EALSLYDSIPYDKPWPKLGELAGPMHTLIGWRCVTAVGPAPAQSGVGALVHLEPIDCFRRERDFDEEVVALRKAGWEEVIDGRARRGGAGGDPSRLRGPHTRRGGGADMPRRRRAPGPASRGWRLRLPAVALRPSAKARRSD